MASKETITKALITIFTELDRLMKKPPSTVSKAVPTIAEQEKAASRIPQAIQAKHDIDYRSGQTRATDETPFIAGADTLEEKGLNQFQRAKIEAAETSPPVSPKMRDPKVLKELEENRFDKNVSQVDRPEEHITREIMEEVTGPRDVVHPDRTRNSLDQLDNLFGEEEARQVDNIKKLLKERGIKRRAGEPTTRDRAEAENVTREVVAKKRVDQEAKKVFQEESGLGGIGDRLDIGKVDERVIGQRGEKINPQVGEAVRRLKPIRKEAAQAAQRGRKTGDASELEAIRDRITSPPKGSDNQLNSLIKTLILRESRNRKTNQPISTKVLKDRIRELGGTKEMINAIRVSMKDRINARGQR